MMSLSHRLKGLFFFWFDRTVPVKVMERTRTEQGRLDRHSRRMHLYYSCQCPSSITVKRQCEHLGLRVVEKDVLRVNAYRNELLKGGAPRVPCLRVDDGDSRRWLYGQRSIDSYLKRYQ